MEFRFTLFNGLTLFVAALAVVIAVRRFRGRFRSNWPLVCYGAIAGYAVAFHYSLGLYWVGSGILCGVLVRAGIYPRQVRLIEYVILAYFVWRCVQLVLML